MTVPMSRAELELAREELAHLKSWGYAPGNYMCKCLDDQCSGDPQPSASSLKDLFLGDKRAWRCERCATQRYEAAQKIKATPLNERETRTPQLVRDRMRPREGVNEKNEQLPYALEIGMLVQKAFLELAELAGDLTRPNEYGDMFDVLYALAARNGVSLEDIEKARVAKHAAKGGFYEANFWTPQEFMDDDRAA